MPASLMWARGFEARGRRASTFVPPPGTDVEGGHAALPDRRPADVHRAEPPVPDGQPDRVQRTFTLRTSSPSTTARARPRRSASRCTTTAPTARPTPSPATSRRSSARRWPIFGELPRFDNGTYTFLADYLPWASGDGMEHRNSTVLVGAGRAAQPGAAQGILGTVAHEFFHAWNMERIRAAGDRAVRLRGGQHVGRAVVRRRLHQLLRRPASSHRAGPAVARRPARQLRRRSSTRSTLSPGPHSSARRRR